MDELWGVPCKEFGGNWNVITSLYVNYIDTKPGTYVIILYLYISPCNKRLSIRIIGTLPISRPDYKLAPSQWETSLQSNAVSHWLGTTLESALIIVPTDCGMPLCDWYPTRSNVSESWKQVSPAISQNQPNKYRKLQPRRTWSLVLFNLSRPSQCVWRQGILWSIACLLLNEPSGTQNASKYQLVKCGHFVMAWMCLVQM